MTSDEDIERAVQEERERCLKLLEFYDSVFSTPEQQPTWNRVKNQISLGIDPAKADFFTQMFGEDDEDWDDEDDGDEELFDDEGWDEDGDTSLRVDEPH
ncbi:hypothetical protein VN12_16505 [Pirellula sp. SH-Sr6A]|uniref:hypothetical protein n=1 Tax=Pirellula sp. SH-Sr6A TaxID=1632865 RepID=UPI00078CE6D8|nr:hypothetical protein [Pirellula sp. SH-Sr6A]AMV33732.1 hypothetical protein VN12_16505 [Pirellula sp. SH-Sr6A]